MTPIEAVAAAGAEPVEKQRHRLYEVELVVRRRWLMVAVARVLLESIKEVTVVDLLIATDLREISL